MASRTKQKEEARARRIAEERAATERARRQRRTRMLGGVLAGAIVVVVIAIIVSSSGGGSKGAPAPTSSAAKQSASTVASLLSGIPQSGMRLGSSKAQVVVTEFGDLQCPICRDFSLGAEKQLISNDVRSGKVQLVYKSLETATGNGPDPGVFPTQQAAAYAAGLQGKGWDYVLLFYREQGTENTAYVTPNYLNGLAKQISGLSYAKWSSDRGSSSLLSRVTAEEQLAQTLGLNSTPAITVQGPKGEAQPIIGDTDYNTLESAINSVK
jgi:protein-disulfide isomerase